MKVRKAALWVVVLVLMGTFLSPPLATAEDDEKAKPVWPDKDEWGEPSAADETEFARPIFGVAVTNKTWKARWIRNKYIWRDPRDGSQWTRYRRVRDGDLFTLYVKITAIDVPKKVMGMTGKLVFPHAGETDDLTFPVRTVPLKAGESRTEKIQVHVPQATIDREGGSWLRKIKAKDLNEQIFVRLGAVRFGDGTRAVYNSEATVAESDKPLGVEQVVVIHEPPPGPKPKVTASRIPLAAGMVLLEDCKVIPFSRRRVWVRPYSRDDGTHVRGHWRRGPGK